MFTLKSSCFTVKLLLLSALCFVQIYGYAVLDIRQDEKAKTIHRLDTLNIFAYVCILILIVCTIWLFKHKRVKFIHETGLAIIYGLIVGAIIRYSGSATEITQMSVVPKTPNITNGSSLNKDVPPDMLWIEFHVPAQEQVISRFSLGNNMSITLNKKFEESPHTEARSYAYVFQGEIYNPSTDSKPKSKKILEKATFDPEIFFNLILPLIVFNAGYSLKRKFFFRNFGAIMTYAFIGTTISCFIVGIVMKCLVLFMPQTLQAFGFIDCLYFGAIISATDPVTVLAIFNDLHVDVTLHALVFGESILNDVISIVLASSIDSFSSHYNFGFFFAVYSAITNFLYIFVCSLLQGSAIGCVTALLTKYTKLCDHPLLESTLFVLMSYASFLLSEALELSGIVSVLFCGICQAHYTYNNLSPESRVRTKSLFEMCNFIAENFIFAYIGVSIFTFPQHLWSFWFIIWTLLAIILGRALNIYPLSYFLNLGRNNKIPLEFQHVLFFSGLRGAMAFALAIRNTLTDSRRMMLTSTSVVSILSVIFCGSSIQPMLQHFFIATNVDEAADNNENSQFGGFRRRTGSFNGELISPTDDVTIGQASTSTNANKNVYEKAWLVRKWYNFDSNFMKPLLTHSKPSLMETMPCCLPVARFLTSSQQMMGTDGSGNQKMANIFDDDDLEQFENETHYISIDQFNNRYQSNNNRNHREQYALRSTNRGGANIENNGHILEPLGTNIILNNGRTTNSPNGLPITTNPGKTSPPPPATMTTLISDIDSGTNLSNSVVLSPEQFLSKTK